MIKGSLSLIVSCQGVVQLGGLVPGYYQKFEDEEIISLNFSGFPKAVTKMVTGVSKNNGNINTKIKK